MDNQSDKPPADELQLFVPEIEPFCNWHAAVVCWNGTRYFQWKESILHGGFNLSLRKCDYQEPEYDQIDRLLFYLSAADGWNNHCLLERPGDKDIQYDLGLTTEGRTIRKSPSGLRQQLARKAFDMLCLNFFNLELKQYRDGHNTEWERIVFSEKFLPQLINFFRVEQEKYGDDFIIRNLSHGSGQSHNEQLAIDFIFSMVKFVWEWKEPYLCGCDRDKTGKYYKALRQRIDSAKPWLIEILNWLGKLHLLDELILKLDDPCLVKLREIAWRSELDDIYHPVDKDRPVASLEEACYVGSAAAWLLKRHELMTRVHRRLEGVLMAQRAKKRLDERIKKLSKVE